MFSTLQLYLGSQYVNDFNYLGRTYQVFAQADEQFRRSNGGHRAAQGAQRRWRDGADRHGRELQGETAPYRVPRYNLYPAAEVMGAAAPGVARARPWSTSPNSPSRCCRRDHFEWTELAHQQQQQGMPTLVDFRGLRPVRLPRARRAVRELEDAAGDRADRAHVPAGFAVGLDSRGMPIDILAQIGFVVLVGLAAKNAILIVEFAKQRQDIEGDSAEEAAVNSAQTRLRPILMTSFAFIAGVAPLAVAAGAGSEMRQSLGTAVFFGMLGVTVFGLVFTPAFYTFIRKRRPRIMAAHEPSGVSPASSGGVGLRSSRYGSQTASSVPVDLNPNMEVHNA